MAKLKTLIDEESLNRRITELAETIERDYEGKDITFVCILKGSVVFAVELAKRINKNVKFEFIKVSSYHEGTESTGEVKMELDLKGSIQGKNIIVIEDIIDTGKTLSYLIEYLKVKRPASVKLCTLLDKPERREEDVQVDYVGFQIPNEFVVGFGLDYNEDYRNLPYIGYFEKELEQQVEEEQPKRHINLPVSNNHEHH